MILGARRHQGRCILARMPEREWLLYETRYQDSEGRRWVKVRLDDAHEADRVIQIEETTLSDTDTLESRARRQLEIPDNDAVVFVEERRT